MAEGFDLESFRASQAEILKKTFPVRLGSEKVTHDEDGNEIEPFERDVIVNLPDPNDWPLEAQMKAGDGDVAGFITMLVGPEKFDLFLSFGWTNRELKAMTDAMAAWSGFDQGTTSPPPPGRGSTPRSN